MAANGQAFTPRSKDKLPLVQSICFGHQSLPPTMSLMQSGYTWRERQRKEEENTSWRRGDSFGTAGGLLGYHSLITAIAQDAEWPRKWLSITRNTISGVQGWGANGCFHGEGNLANGKVDGSITRDGIMCDCYPSQARYDGQGL